jgi:hypothetical protein
MSFVPPDLDKILEGAEPTTIFRDAARTLRVADEMELYGRDYPLRHGLITECEYNSIKPSTTRADAFQQAQDEVYLRHRVVGSEF